MTSAHQGNLRFLPGREGSLVKTIINCQLSGTVSATLSYINTMLIIVHVCYDGSCRHAAYFIYVDIVLVTVICDHRLANAKYGTQGLS